MKSNIENIKSSNKPFKIFDLIVYFALLIIIATLFLSFYLCKKNNSNGFSIFIDDNKVLIYIYGEDNPTYFDNSDEYIIFDKEKCQITIYTSKNHDEYNVISFDNGDFSVKMIDSTCSNSKDCCLMPSVKNSGVIYCAPHKLKISPLYNEKSSPIVG